MFVFAIHVSLLQQSGVLSEQEPLYARADVKVASARVYRVSPRDRGSQCASAARTSGARLLAYNPSPSGAV